MKRYRLFSIGNEVNFRSDDLPEAINYFFSQNIQIQSYIVDLDFGVIVWHNNLSEYQLADLNKILARYRTECKPTT